MSPWLRPRSPTSTTASSLDFLIKTVRVRPLPSFLWSAASFLGEAKPTAPTKTTPNATTEARRTNTFLLNTTFAYPFLRERARLIGHAACFARGGASINGREIPRLWREPDRTKPATPRAHFWVSPRTRSRYHA